MPNKIATKPKTKEQNKDQSKILGDKSFYVIILLNFFIII